MRIVTPPNHPLRSAARRGATRLILSRPGRAGVRRVAVNVLATRTGRRMIRRYARRRATRAVAQIRWQPALYVPAAVAFARLRRRLGPPPPAVTLAVAYATPVAVASALPRGRVRTYATWLAHMWAYKVAFEVPYDCPARQRRRLRVDEPIALDRAIGGGMPPSERLQRRLRRPPRLTVLDKLVTGIYVLWEIEPHLALAWLLSRHPGRFPGAAVRLALTFDATLIGYFAVPTAPPWWASECEGRMEGQVRRVTAEVMLAVRGERRPGTPQDHVPGANPWAAWPSDHFASALSAAIALGEAEPRAGALGFGYAAALGFALVYTGEHYVIDLMLGAALALAIHGAASWLTGPPVRLVEAAIQPGPRWKRLSRVAR